MNNVWNVKVVKSFFKNMICISKGNVLKIKDKFPDDSGNCDKGVWQIKAPYPYGDLFYMDYEEREKYLELIND